MENNNKIEKKYLTVAYSDHLDSKNVEEVISDKENFWKGWYCSAGMSNLYIDYDGNVFLCNNSSSKVDRFNYKGWELKIKELKLKGIDLLTEESHNSGLYKKHQRIFEKSGDGFGNELDFYDTNSVKKNWGFLGSIYQNFHINKNIVKCPYTQCGCGSDIPIAKAKNKEDLQKYLLLGEKSLKPNGSADSNIQLVSRTGGQEPTVLWDISRKCNYDCSYCWPAVHNAKEAHKDFELILKTCNKIIKELAPTLPKLFCFSGGEPTLHPNIKEILEHLKANQQRTLITTNGSFKSEKWKDLVPMISIIQMSAHFEFLNIDRFVANILIVLEYMIESPEIQQSIDIKLMTPPGELQRSIELKERIYNLKEFVLAKEMKLKYILVSLVPLRGIDNSEALLDYTEEELELF